MQGLRERMREVLHSDWTPDTAVSLWKQIGDPTVEYPEWSHPLGAFDAYAVGAKVSHNGKNWVGTR